MSIVVLFLWFTAFAVAMIRIHKPCSAHGESHCGCDS